MSASGESANERRPYFDELTTALGRARELNREALGRAASIVEQTVAGDGIVYVIGSGHSQLAALEMNRRAGVFASLQVLYDPTWAVAEHLEGYGDTLLLEGAPGAGDCLIAISHSGTTATAIDVARKAKAAGAKVIVISSSRAGALAKPKHSSGLKLPDLADVVLDNGSGDSDPQLTVTGQEARFGPTSTIVSAALLHEIVLEAVERLAARGLDVPVIVPNAMPGGRERNEALLAHYRGRIRRVP